jgi:hypothetical protein
VALPVLIDLKSKSTVWQDPEPFYISQHIFQSMILLRSLILIFISPTSYQNFVCFSCLLHESYMSSGQSDQPWEKVINHKSVAWYPRFPTYLIFHRSKYFLADLQFMFSLNIVTAQAHFNPWTHNPEMLWESGSVFFFFFLVAQVSRGRMWLVPKWL